jgi:hypothetical protein
MGTEVVNITIAEILDQKYSRIRPVVLLTNATV